MSKNLNRRFFYDFLLALAKEYEVNPDAIETPFIIGKKNHLKKKFFVKSIFNLNIYRYA